MSSVLLIQGRTCLSDAPEERRVLLAWGAFSLTVLACFPAPTLPPIPVSPGTLVAQGTLVVAFLLALLAKPLGRPRPNSARRA